MENINYKKFISLSKYVTNYSQMSPFKKLVFYLEAPIRYKKFKKAYKEEIKNKGKEVK